MRLGYVYGELRWRTQDGRFLLTWDGLHGEIESFTLTGRHNGVLHAMTGVGIKPPVKGRKINV